MSQESIYQAWKPTVIGQPVDIDKQYGNQCADVILSLAMTYFPGVKWQTLIPPTMSAKDFGKNHNDTYFEWIENDHNNPNQLPIQGDILVCDATPKAGYSNATNNPDGHTGAVDSADSTGYTLTMQDGSNPSGRTFTQHVAWRFRPVLGWLRPRLAAAPTPPAPTPGKWNVGDNVWLHANTWRTYDVGAAPNGVSNKVLLPNNYNHGPNGQQGTIYSIKKLSPYANTVTITTDTWGDRDIYLDSDATKV